MKKLSNFFKKLSQVNIIILLLLLFVTVSAMFSNIDSIKDITTEKQSKIDSDKYVNQEIIPANPEKITPYKDFAKLKTQQKIDTVYYQSDSSIISFTVKKNAKVSEVAYRTPLRSEIFINLTEKNNAKRNKNKNAIFTYRTFHPKTDNFKEELLNSGIQVIELQQEIQGNGKQNPSIATTLMQIALLIIIARFFMSKIKPQNKSTSRLIDIPKINFTDIAGNEEAKEDMKYLVDFLKNPVKYTNMGAEIPKGVIFYGDPGTGKTLMAKAIAGEAQVPFFYASGSEFVEMFVGVGAKRVRELFTNARKESPCIIFIDEIDAVGGKRGISTHKEGEQTLNQLLTELDGFTGNQRIIVIAATNRIDTLDPALIRAGRFDKHIAIRLPSAQDREKILLLHSENKKIAEAVDFKEVAKLTIGFSGADLKALMNESAIIATIKDRKEIEREDIDEAYFKIITKAHNVKSKNKNKEEIEIIAYHEAGHALAAKLLTNNEVHKVTIIGTTNGAGGLTAITPSKVSLLSQEDLYNEVRVLYAGRVAEYLLYNEDNTKITTGAVNDIERATNIIDRIVCNYGMSKLGLLKIVEVDIDKNSLYATKSNISNQLYEETVILLRKNKDKLEEIAQLLINKETISDKELEDVLNNNKIN